MINYDSLLDLICIDPDLTGDKVDTVHTLGLRHACQVSTWVCWCVKLWHLKASLCRQTPWIFSWQDLISPRVSAIQMSCVLSASHNLLSSLHHPLSVLVPDALSSLIESTWPWRTTTHCVPPALPVSFKKERQRSPLHHSPKNTALQTCVQTPQINPATSHLSSVPHLFSVCLISPAGSSRNLAQ